MFRQDAPVWPRGPFWTSLQTDLKTHLSSSLLFERFDVESHKTQGISTGALFSCEGLVPDGLAQSQRVIYRSDGPAFAFSTLISSPVFLVMVDRLEQSVSFSQQGF